MSKALKELCWSLFIFCGFLGAKLAGIYMILQAVSLAAHNDIVTWQSCVMAFVGLSFYTAELRVNHKSK